MRAPQQYLSNHLLLGLGEGNNGFFKVPHPSKAYIYYVQASDGLGWEHLSVSLSNRKMPTWDDMCFIKGLFWDDEDCVIQYHPPKSEYVNIVHNCLHLWRPLNEKMPIPPSIMVGPK